MSTTPTTLPHHHKPGTVRAALSYRKFRLLFTGTALSMVGTWMQNFTLPAYIDARTGSASLVGLLIFVQLGPLLLLSVPSGVLADRVDRTRLVIAMQTVMLVMSVVLASVIALDAPLWTIFAAQLSIGIANTVNAPAFNASIPMLVERADLPGAISLQSAAMNGSRIMGPALAALLAAVGLSVPQLFLVNAGTFLFLIVPLLLIRLPNVTSATRRRGWRQLTTGFSVARQRLVIGRTLMAMFLFSMICLPYIGLFPSVARLNLGIDTEGNEYRMLFIVWGLGAFLGALSVGTWLSSIDTRRLVPFGFAGFAASLGGFALASDVRVAYPVALALGFVYFMTATALSSVFQQNLADTERAAVMPLWFMVFGGTVPLGNLIAGPIMDEVGARPVLLVGAIFAVFLARWADLTRLGEDAFLPEHLGGEPFRPVNATRQF